MSEENVAIIRIAKTIEQLDETEQGKDVSGLLSLILPKINPFDKQALFSAEQWPNKNHPRKNAIRQLAREIFYCTWSTKISDSKEEILNYIHKRLQLESFFAYKRRTSLGKEYPGLTENSPENQVRDWKTGQRALAVYASTNSEDPIEFFYEGQAVDIF